MPSIESARGGVGLENPERRLRQALRPEPRLCSLQQRTSDPGPARGGVHVQAEDMASAPAVWVTPEANDADHGFPFLRHLCVRAARAQRHPPQVVRGLFVHAVEYIAGKHARVGIAPAGEEYAGYGREIRARRRPHLHADWASPTSRAAT